MYGDIPFKEQAHFATCHSDYVVRACHSLSSVVYQAIFEFNEITDQYDDLNTLRQFLDAHQFDCRSEVFDVMNIDSTTTTLTAVWDLETNTDYLALGLTGIEDPVFTFEWEIDDVYIPGELGEFVYQCDSYSINDDEIFADGTTDPSEFTLDTTDADAILLGPQFSGKTVEGSLSLDSPTNLLKFSQTSETEWTLSALELRTTSPVTVGNGDVSVEVEYFDLKLLMPQYKLPGNDTRFELAPGQGFFFLSGRSDGLPYVLILPNATRIRFEKDSEGLWSTSTFGFQFFSDSSTSWNLAVSSQNWE